ncbi:MAG: TlpA family protein disulfide reductase [Campylobacteraceae bacterium]|jgi:thiol-disulfide isomerase/thioredoxin|nr:TlpA family protein disulfide reductase [Campylobacteraceae bacterium]
MTFDMIKKAAVLMAALFFLTACSKNIGEKKHITLNGKNSEVSALVTYFTASNKTLKLESGKPFLLFFTSTTCGACAEAVPYINYFDEKYADKLEVIGIMNGDLGLDKGFELLSAKNINFRVISEIKSVDYFSRAVGGIYGTPVFYIYDKDGVLKKKFLGLTPQSILEEGIKDII